ncbi:MAG TPA: hypothetical protein PKA74_16375, partial [Bauldia sp.]|nr:hypothetical protein [Bauldia sp.]
MPDPVGSITIDASTATAAVDFDTYVATYMAGLTVAGYPVFDNSMAFAGEEMVVSYGAGPTGKYVLAHGDLTYNFGTHIVHGEINTISFGTFGTGTYDGTTGYLTGANVDLTITGLLLANDFPGTVEEQAAVMASGEVHNFAAIAMAGANASATRIALFNEQLDAYAQTFVGSIYGDTYTGTGFNDTVTGGLGNDTIDGGDGIDTVVFSGNHADYTIVENPDGTVTVTDNNTGDGDDGTDTLSNIEKLQFQDDTYDAPVNDAPTAPVLSGAVTLGTAATVFVKEDVAVGTVVGTVSSTDPEGGTVTLALTAVGDGLFELVGSELRLKGALDHETKASHTVTVTATDEAGNVTTKDVVIQVRDVLEGPEGTLAIDGSALGSAGYNMATFLATYFTGTGTGSSTFYGGTADANPYGGGVVYQNGSEVGFRYGSTDRQVILDGDLAYDFIHNGSAYGHGITGAIDSVLLAYRDGNTVPSSEADGTNGPGELTGVIPGVVISGFDIEAAAGSGNTADNLVYRLYDALRKSNIATVQTILDQYA